MADETSTTDRVMPKRVMLLLVAAAKVRRKATGKAPTAGPEMNVAMMRATTGLLAEDMIHANRPNREQG